MPQLSPPAAPHPAGTSAGSLPDSARQNQRQTTGFAAENRVGCPSVRWLGAGAGRIDRYVARPLIKVLSSGRDGRSGTFGFTRPRRAHQSGGLTGSRREVLTPDCWTGPRRWDQRRERTGEPYELIRRPGCRACHKPRFLLRQAARTYPPPCSLFFCAHKSVASWIATMIACA